MRRAFIPPDDEEFQQRGDPMPYGRHKRKEYGRMLEYLKAIHEKKPEPTELFSTIHSPDAHTVEEAYTTVRKIATQTNVKLADEQSKKLRRKKNKSRKNKWKPLSNFTVALPYSPFTEKRFKKNGKRIK